MSLNYIQDFDRLFSEVFDESGNVRPCKEQSCKELITVCVKINKYGYQQYGNCLTGEINAGAVKDLHEQLVHVRRD